MTGWWVVLLLAVVVFCQAQASRQVTFKLYYSSRYPKGTYTVSSVRYISRQYFSSSKTTYIVIHGWKMRGSDMNHIMAELLQRREPIFVVDWNYLAKNRNYPTACDSTRYVGSQVASFIRGLEQRTSARRDKMHVIGFSLGGKVSAAMADNLGWRKVKRITGLDTPLYCTLGVSRPKLDPSDAEFVDTIRTTFLSGILSQRQGHADFWTCKNLQCINIDVKVRHEQAIHLFANSINRSSCKLRGRACTLQIFQKPKCYGHTNYMGFSAYKPRRDTMYYVASVPSYCKR